MKILMVLSLITLLMSGCAVNPATGDIDFMVVTKESEQSMGDDQYKLILYRYGEYKLAKLNEYVTDVGNKVAAQSDLPEKNFEFFVLDTMDVNAFALPGGYIFITRGMLIMLKNESELAAVLGHEIAHVTARHAAKKISTSYFMTFLQETAGSAFPELKSRLGAGMYNFAGGALLSGYGRDYELQSDSFGAKYIAKAGYDPNAMFEVISILKNHEIFLNSTTRGKVEESFYHGLFKTHPDNDTRLQEAIEESAKYTTNGAEWHKSQDAYYNAISGIEVGYSRQQGFVYGNNFMHPGIAGGIKVAFPNGWTVHNTNPAVYAMDRSGKQRITMLVAKYSGNAYAQALSMIDAESIDGWTHLEDSTYPTYTGVAKVKKAGNIFYIRISLTKYKQSAFIIIGKPKYTRGSANFDMMYLDTVKSIAPLTKSDLAKITSRYISIVPLANKKDLYNSIRIQDKTYAYGYLLLINGLFPDKPIINSNSYKIIK